MHLNCDFLGYYSALGVKPSATSEEIKKAFRTKAQEVHPDRNSAPDATKRFQFLNDAFQTLSNPEARAQYDAEGSASLAEDNGPPVFEPLICSVCKKISAQPRYAIYYQVVSFIVFTQRSVSQGIFCSACGAKAAYRASLVTVFFGWWGFPWGPIWTLPALVRNLLGGTQPPMNNFKILWCQAMYFASIRRIEIASAMALDALNFGAKLSSAERADANVNQLLEALGYLLAVAKSGTSTLPKVWGFGSKTFKVQAIGGVIVAVAITVAVAMIANTPRTAYRHTPPTGAQESKAPAPAPVAVFDQPEVPYPPTGRIRTLRVRRPESEMAPLKIVTATGGFNYYAKLVGVETGKPALILFVRAGDTVETELPIGSYYLKFAAGERWYGEDFLFGPDTSYSKADEPLLFRIEGHRVFGHVIELIKQVNGNLRETPISPTDF